MDIHYNAFISYRHHPQDIKVAEQIHRGLEHYRIPKALKKKNAKMRLFRDKEELPITSNLSDDITRALHNSDYLIVICSTHTKESLWVQREIETFLQSHDHNRILTVLVDGEPCDTIPQILFSREEVDPVTGEKKTAPVEPLSCDWRFGKRKAYREELPRLAAALLGCGYDELRRRERQYRLRRAMTAAAIAFGGTLAFTGYVVYNSIQIQKANELLTQANIEIQQNLEEAQINQSNYLASASTQERENGDRMLAMALAMAALPESQGQRPYVAPAEFALAEAVGAYLSESEVAAVGSITCDATVSRFDATEARDWMYVIDERHMLSIWDLDTYRQQGARQLEAGASKLVTTPDDHVVLMNSLVGISCYDTELDLLWQTESVNDMVMSQDRETVIAWKDGNALIFLDSATGEEVLPQVQVLMQPEDYTDGWRIRFTQDAYDLEKPILLEYYNYGEDSHIIKVDLSTGTMEDLGAVPEDYDVRSTLLTDRGDAIALTVSERGLWNGSFGEMMTHSPVGISVVSFGTGGQTLWQAELTSYSYSDVTTLYQIPGTSQLFCQVDNLLALIELTTGQVLRTCETGAAPVWIDAKEMNATIVLEDGSMGTYTYGENEFNSTRYFKENITQAIGGRGVFVRQFNSSQILAYTAIRDDNWEIIGGDYNPNTIHKAVWGDLVAIYNYDSISLFDIAKGEHLWSIDESSGVYFQLLEFSEDGTKVWISVNGDQLAEVDVQSGDWETYDLPERLDGDIPLYYSSNFRECMTQGMIYAMAQDLWSGEVYVIAFDTQTKAYTATKVCKPEETIYADDCVILTARDGIAYLWEMTTGAVYEVDTAAGTVRTFREGVSARPVIQFLDEEGSFMVCQDHKAEFFQPDGTQMFQAELGYAKGVSAGKIDGQILLLTDSGDFLRFGLDGQKLGETGGNLYSSFFYNTIDNFEPEEIRWTMTKDGSLFVNIFSAGNIISTEDWEVRAWVPNCVAYLSGLDRVVTVGLDPEDWTDKMGSYPCYTLEDIMDMATAAMKGYSLTQDQKDWYGIS